MLIIQPYCKSTVVKMYVKTIYTLIFLRFDFLLLSYFNNVCDVSEITTQYCNVLNLPCIYLISHINKLYMHLLKYYVHVVRVY